MLPQDTEARLFTRQADVVADAICDALILLSWERHRAAVNQSAEWQARQLRKVDGGMAALAGWAGTSVFMVNGQFGLADIAAGTVCRYLDLRFPDCPWRSGTLCCPLIKNAIERQPSFQGSVPVLGTISDEVV